MNDLRQNAPTPEKTRTTVPIWQMALGAFWAAGGLMLMIRPDPTFASAVVRWTLRVACGIFLVGLLWNIWRQLYPPKQ